ncbi:MAG: T9SS type A sorting domain-containing protein [Bacteroidetes bacterium]|nr:T9SS type A sorting domain-containing protein [Bacteroidota bacterium]
MFGLLSPEMLRPLEPLILRGFTSSAFDHGVPNDNHLAISNDSMLISVFNSWIEIFNVKQDSMIKKVSLGAFSSSLGISGGKFDPKVVYDPNEDRFSIIFLNSYNDSTSWIMLGFSQTNDPLGDWNVYALPGNQFKDLTWSDYPIVALSDKELFITINALWNDSSWQAGFVRSVIWQIDKFDGYNGDSLDLSYISNTKYNGQAIRNLMPVKGGSKLKGPNMFFLSNRNFDVQNDSIFILEITGVLDDAQTVLKINVETADIPYGMPPDAHQTNNYFFATNDARILGAFYEGDQIQYVQNTVDPNTGFAAVYHGIIHDISSDRSITGTIIGDPVLEFGYPNISFTGRFEGDQEALISFNHAADTVHSGFSIIYYKNDSSYTNITTVKEGENFVNKNAGSKRLSRWGDYTGSQRKYNEPGKVWISGSYGLKIKQGLFYVRLNFTWIAEILSVDSIRIPPKPPVIDSVFSSNTYPNPVANLIYVDFIMPEAAFIDVTVYDLNGRKIRTLISDNAKQGKNQLSFSTSPLMKGLYFVVIRDEDRLIKTHKFTKF